MNQALPVVMKLFASHSFGELVSWQFVIFPNRRSHLHLHYHALNHGLLLSTLPPSHVAATHVPFSIKFGRTIIFLQYTNTTITITPYQLLMNSMALFMDFQLKSHINTTISLPGKESLYIRAMTLPFQRISCPLKKTFVPLFFPRFRRTSLITC